MPARAWGFKSPSGQEEGFDMVVGIPSANISCQPLITSICGDEGYFLFFAVVV